MNNKLAHYYKQARKHQIDTYGNSGLHIDGVDQRQFVGGGAAYGFHAYAAFLSAKQRIHFVKNLHDKIVQGDKRSKAAKRGWKTRRGFGSGSL